MGTLARVVFNANIIRAILTIWPFQQQMRVTRHRVLAKFGLMHMIGTNLSVWLNVLVQETKHEILTFYNPADNSIGVDKQPNHFSRKSAVYAIRHSAATRVSTATSWPQRAR